MVVVSSLFLCCQEEMASIYQSIKLSNESIYQNIKRVNLSIYQTSRSQKAVAVSFVPVMSVVTDSCVSTSKMGGSYGSKILSLAASDGSTGWTNILGLPIFFENTLKHLYASIF